MAGRTFLASWQLSANRSHACAMWARVTRASRSPNVRAISKHCCARRRYSSALLTAITLARPPARRANARGRNWFGPIEGSGGLLGRAAPTCIREVTGVRNAPRCNVGAAPEAHTLHRQWLAEG